MIGGFRGKISDVDLRLLRVFTCVVKHKGFAAAEVNLNKSRSAISMDIGDLEKRIGVKLCLRGPSGFSLTKEGQLIYEATVELLEDIDSFTSKVGYATSRLVGDLRIATVDKIAPEGDQAIVNSIASFSKMHPDVSIVIDQLSDSQVIESVIESDAHIGFSSKNRNVQGLKFMPAFKERVELYCGRRHPLFDAKDNESTMSDISDYPSYGFFGCTDLESLFGLKLNVQARATSMDGRAALIRTGQFIGYLPVHFAAYWVERGIMRSLLPHKMAVEEPIYVVFRSSSEVPAVQREYCKYLFESLKLDEALG